MAVAKAQYAISEICAMLRAKGVNVRVRMFHNIDVQYFFSTSSVAVRNSPSGWAHARSMQRPSSRSFRPL